MPRNSTVAPSQLANIAQRLVRSIGLLMYYPAVWILKLGILVLEGLSVYVAQTKAGLVTTFVRKTEGQRLDSFGSNCRTVGP